MMNEMEEKKLNMNELARTAGGFDDPYFDDFPTDAITDELVSFHYDSYRPGSHAPYQPKDHQRPNNPWCSKEQGMELMNNLLEMIEHLFIDICKHGMMG